MRRGIYYIFTVLLTLLTGATIFLFSRPLSFASSIDIPSNPVLERMLKKHKELSAHQEELQVEKQRKINEQTALIDEIDKLKQDSGWNFIDRIRLERLLARNLDISKQLEQLEAQLHANSEEISKFNGSILSEYYKMLEDTVSMINREKDRNKIFQLTRQYLAIRQYMSTYRHSISFEKELALFDLSPDPLDGPSELREKARILRERRKNLLGVINKIDSMIASLKKEWRLAREMRDLVREGNLFDDGTAFSTAPRQPKQEQILPEQPVEPVGPGSQYPGISTLKQPGAQGSSRPGGEDRSKLDSLSREISRLVQEREHLKKLVEELAEKAAALEALANRMDFEDQKGHKEMSKPNQPIRKE